MQRQGDMEKEQKYALKHIAQFKSTAGQLPQRQELTHVPILYPCSMTTTQVSSLWMMRLLVSRHVHWWHESCQHTTYGKSCLPLAWWCTVIKWVQIVQFVTTTIKTSVSQGKKFLTQLPAWWQLKRSRHCASLCIHSADTPPAATSCIGLWSVLSSLEMLYHPLLTSCN